MDIEFVRSRFIKHFDSGTGPDFVYDNPPVYQVSGYSYYNSHGTFVVVGPSMRTMPDASVYNNLSYKG
jgi:hypothetical protein